MMKSGYVVADIMTTKPVTCPPDMTLLDVTKLMKQHEVSSVLVTEQKEFIGIATDKDFLYRACAENLDFSSTPVSSIMSRTDHTITPEIDLLDAVKVMNKKDIHHLPVMDDKKLVGYLTMKTILKIEPQLFDLLAEKIELRGINPDSGIISPYDSELEGTCEACGNYSSRLVEDEGRSVCPNCVIQQS